MTKPIIGFRTGTWRLVAIITPDNFEQKTIFVSTTWNPVTKSGQTAIAESDNHIQSPVRISTSVEEVNYEVIAKHTSERDAIDFHMSRLAVDVYGK